MRDPTPGGIPRSMPANTLVAVAALAAAPVQTNDSATGSQDAKRRLLNVTVTGSSAGSGTYARPSCPTQAVPEVPAETIGHPEVTAQSDDSSHLHRSLETSRPDRHRRAADICGGRLRVGALVADVERSPRSNGLSPRRLPLSDRLARSQPSPGSQRCLGRRDQGHGPLASRRKERGSSGHRRPPPDRREACGSIRETAPRRGEVTMSAGRGQVRLARAGRVGADFSEARPCQTPRVRCEHEPDPAGPPPLGRRPARGWPEAEVPAQGCSARRAQEVPPGHPARHRAHAQGSGEPSHAPVLPGDQASPRARLRAVRVQARAVLGPGRPPALQSSRLPMPSRLGAP